MARKADEPVLDVGVVYLMGTIGESGDFDAGSVRHHLLIQCATIRSLIFAPLRSSEDYGKLEKTTRLVVSF